MSRIFTRKSVLIDTLPNVGTMMFGLLYFLMYKPLGLFPCHFNYLKLLKCNPAVDYYNFGFSRSLLGTYYNILFGIAIAIFNYYYMVYYPEILPKKIGLMVAKEQKYMQASGVGLLAIIQLCYAMRQDTLVNALNQIQGIDDRLLKISGSRVKNGRSGYVMFFVNLAIGAGLLVIKHFELGNKPFLQFFVTVVPSVFVDWMGIQYMILLDLLYKRYRHLYYTMKANDIEGTIQFSRILSQKLPTKAALSDREIEVFTELLDDLDDVRIDIVWFFSPPLAIGALDLAGAGAVIGYDISRALKNESILYPMEIAMYVLWYSMCAYMTLVIVVYYALNKLLEWWIRFNLKMMAQVRLEAAGFKFQTQDSINYQQQPLMKEQENLITLDLSIR